VYLEAEAKVEALVEPLVAVPVLMEEPLLMEDPQVVEQVEEPVARLAGQLVQPLVQGSEQLL
jgi:hypothetical protein